MAHLANVPGQRRADAAVFEVLAGVPHWWAGRARAAGLSGKWLEVDQAVDSEVPEGVLAAAVPGLRGSAEELGRKYVSTLSVKDRSEHGRHYTPDLLAQELWAMTRRAMGWSSPRKLPGLLRDPACGAGALLLPPLREHLGAIARIDQQFALAGLPSHVAGIDTDPNAVWLANVLLAAEMLPILAVTVQTRRRALPALVQVGDGLAPPDARAKITLMNPPYGRVKLGDVERARFANTLLGHANLYGMFLAAGLETMDGDGIISAVVPTSFLAGKYFENLRGAIAQEAPLREIRFVADRSGSFAGVLQETCLATFTQRRARYVTVGTITETAEDLARVPSPKHSRPWILPRRSDDATAAAAALAMPLTVAKAGWKASTGPLVWNRRKNDIFARPSKDRRPIIWAADVDGGAVHRDPARDQQRYLRIRGTDSRYLCLTEPAILLQRTTAPEQSRRLVVAEFTGAHLDAWGGSVIVENHVNVLRPSIAKPSISQATLARVLATETLDRVMRSLSGSVAVSAYEIGSLPLPRALVLKDWEMLTEEELERAVAQAYRPVVR